jgi:hypothetical protein
MVPVDMKVPLNGSFVLTSPPGTDICWRRKAVFPNGAAPSPPSVGWTPWNRVYTSYGHEVDASL